MCLTVCACTVFRLCTIQSENMVIKTEHAQALSQLTAQNEALRNNFRDQVRNLQEEHRKTVETLQQQLSRVEAQLFQLKSEPSTRGNFRAEYQFFMDTMYRSLKLKHAYSVWFCKITRNVSWKICSMLYQSTDIKSGMCLCYYLLSLQNPKVLEYIQRRATKVVEGLEGLSSKEQLRTLGWSILEESRMRATPLLSYRFLRRWSEEGSAELFSLVPI